MTTARQRWYSLHRAQRLARRTDMESFLTLARMRKAGAGAEIDHYPAAAAMRVVNPPMIIDPELPHGGHDMGPKERRLP